MADIFKFPNGGYDVVVYRKQDILDCIDENIIDKDVVLAVITQCEVDATNFLKEGRWTGIPYLGNMRIPPRVKKFREINGTEILETAKQELEENRYFVFRKELNSNICADVKYERFYRYVTSCFVTKNRSLYNYFLKEVKLDNISNRDAYARFMCYSCIDLTNYLPID